MKIVLSLLAIILTGVTSLSQNMPDIIHPLFRGNLNGDLIREYYSFSSAKSPERFSEPVIILGLFSSNKLMITKQLAHEKLPELKNFATDSSSIMEIPAGGYAGKFAIPVFDSSGIIVTANGVNKLNAAAYEFRVLENKTKEVIPWRNITLFCEPYLSSNKPDGTEETQVAYLGEFKTVFGNSLTVEIKKKDTPDVLKSISAIWINISPSVLGVFTANDMQSFLSVFKKQWQHDVLIELTREERIARDSLLMLKNNFTSTESSLIFYLDNKIKSKEVIEYNLISGKQNTGWKANDFDVNLIWLKNLSPGNYTLQMRYSIQRHNISAYEFTIDAAWYQTITFKIITGILGMMFLSFIVILFISYKQKQKLKKEQLQNLQTQTELKSIRAQFNPHFVFNALSSIQGLITRNDMDGANRYLSEFSTLMRDSLKENSNDSVSLATEIKMLDSYLKLEQLRFGFGYTIQSDTTIDKNAVQVPALLLQPLVENAVKHGISSLYEKGLLTISFKRSFADMSATISDNGDGFTVTNSTEGYGLKLTKDRIILLNKMLKEQLIELSIHSSNGGTVIHLLFKNWLS